MQEKKLLSMGLLPELLPSRILCSVVQAERGFPNDILRQKWGQLHGQRQTHAPYVKMLY